MTMPYDKVLCLWILAGVALLWPQNVSGVEISIPRLEKKAGQTIEVPILMDRVSNLAGLKLVITYDKTLLTYRAAEKTRQTDSLMHMANHKKPGLLIVVMAGARGIKGNDFPVLRLYFTVAPGLKTPQVTALKITEVQAMTDALEQLPCRIRTGTIRILP